MLHVRDEWRKLDLIEDALRQLAESSPESGRALLEDTRSPAKVEDG